MTNCTPVSRSFACLHRKKATLAARFRSLPFPPETRSTDFLITTKAATEIRNVCPHQVPRRQGQRKSVEAEFFSHVRGDRPSAPGTHPAAPCRAADRRLPAGVPDTEAPQRRGCDYAKDAGSGRACCAIGAFRGLSCRCKPGEGGNARIAVECDRSLCHDSPVWRAQERRRQDRKNRHRPGDHASQEGARDRDGTLQIGTCKHRARTRKTGRTRLSELPRYRTHGRGCIQDDRVGMRVSRLVHRRSGQLLGRSFDVEGPAREDKRHRLEILGWRLLLPSSRRPGGRRLCASHFNHDQPNVPADAYP